MASTPRTGAALDNVLARARAAGEISADESFAALYSEYRGTVTAWLSLRVESPHVEDLAQDVWLVFYGRWRRWSFGTESESEGARPVLAFLFRTCQFVARAHNRLKASRKTTPSSETLDREAVRGAAELHRDVEASRCLALAERLCTREELDVLAAKLSGMVARDIARALGVTEPVVDHRYRDALERLRRAMNVGTRAPRRKK